MRDHNEVNELLTLDAVVCDSDANGNLEEDDNYSFVYDVNDRLFQVKLRSGGALVSSFGYDAFGRRVFRKDWTTPEEIVYVYDGLQVLEERTPADVLLATYVSGSGLDDRVARITPTETFTYHLDPRMSPVALTDSTGTVVERYVYTAYGELKTLDADWKTPLAFSRVGNPYAYAGRRLDAESGLVDFRARMYSPWLGRFLSRDPLGYVDGMNLYAAYFVPNAVDPRGTSALVTPNPTKEPGIYPPPCSGPRGTIWWKDPPPWHTQKPLAGQPCCEKPADMDWIHYDGVSNAGTNTQITVNVSHAFKPSGGPALHVTWAWWTCFREGPTGVTEFGFFPPWTPNGAVNKNPFSILMTTDLESYLINVHYSWLSCTRRPNVPSTAPGVWTRWTVMVGASFEGNKSERKNKIVPILDPN